MFVVLDTNHFREVALNTLLAEKLSRRIAEANAEVLITIITVQEATEGWLALINRAAAGRPQIGAYLQFQNTVSAFQKFIILSFDEEAADVFHQLQIDRPRIGTMDLKIAAICKAHDAVLLSRNLIDFQKVSGLRVENWLD